MTVEFYEEMAEVATEILEEFGKEVQVKKVADGSGEYDPDSGTTEPAETTVDGFGAFFSFPPNVSTRNGVLVQTGDKMLLLDVSGADVIAPSDVIVNGSEVWGIAGIDTLKPADTAVLHILHVRQS